MSEKAVGIIDVLDDPGSKAGATSIVVKFCFVDHGISVIYRLYEL